jgi:flagellar hook capping protein FlgD
MVAKRFAYVCAGILLCAFACGCGTEDGGTGPYRWPPAEVDGRVQLRAALRAADATFQGYRVIIDANGVPVDLTFGATLVASTQTAGGAYHFTEDHALNLQDYLVRTVVATALADSAVAIYLGVAILPDTLRLFSDEATQIVPNPFDGQADIHVEVTTAERVVVEARSLSGGLVRRLLDTSLDPGLHAIRWDGANDAGAQVPYGLYWIVTTLGAVQHAELAIRSP